jgi:hypothetical protein|tara:strand:+ start:2612 stop:3067 length:456 start_codon:yes stop_codon:yes gene_type:complete
MSRIIADIVKNVVRTNQVNDNLEKTFDMKPMENNQTVQIVPKKKGRGGARPNSGRKVGSTVKLSAVDILKEIERKDKPFAEGLAEDYATARRSGDLNVIQRYQQMFLSKVIADKQAIDITTMGESLHNHFTFPNVELKDWKVELDSQPKNE